MYPSPCCSLSILFVKSWSMNASHEKSTRNSSSSGFDNFTKLSAAFSTADRLSYIEPELSISSPSDTASSPRRTELILCGPPAPSPPSRRYDEPPNGRHPRPHAFTAKVHSTPGDYAPSAKEAPAAARVVFSIYASFHPASPPTACSQSHIRSATPR